MGSIKMLQVPEAGAGRNTALCYGDSFHCSLLGGGHAVGWTQDTFWGQSSLFSPFLFCFVWLLLVIFRIRWPETISNRELWKRTKQQAAQDEILQRPWRWIGHTLQKPLTCTCQALIWNPQGRRKRGRPRNTWRRDLEAETKRSCCSWGQLERLAQDRDAWRALVGGLGSNRGQRQWWWYCLVSRWVLPYYLICRGMVIPGTGVMVTPLHSDHWTDEG